MSKKSTTPKPAKKAKSKPAKIKSPAPSVAQDEPEAPVPHKVAEEPRPIRQDEIAGLYAQALKVAIPAKAHSTDADRIAWIEEHLT